MDDILYPKEDTLKLLCLYLYQECQELGGQEEGYLEDVESL